jgi:hypothetical protein
MLKKLGLTFFALISTVLIANAISGNQLGFPVIGGPSYCSSYGNNSVCSNTVAAGPALTGSETIVANTNAAGGVQTGLLSLPAIGAGALVVSTPTTGTTITVDAVTRQLIVAPTTTIAALGVTLPSAASTMYNGQRIGVCGTQIVTAVTMTAGTGNTFGSTVTSQAMLVPVVTGGASCMEWIYSKTSDAAGIWYRTQ